MNGSVVDSWGRPEPGIAGGNLLWVGRFSECREVAAALNASYFAVDLNVFTQKVVEQEIDFLKSSLCNFLIRRTNTLL